MLIKFADLRPGDMYVSGAPLLCDASSRLVLVIASRPTSATIMTVESRVIVVTAAEHHRVSRIVQHKD